MFAILAVVYIPNILLQSLYDTFVKPRSIEEQYEKDFAKQVREKLKPQLIVQEYKEDLSNLIDEINRIALDIYTEYAAYRTKIDNKRKSKARSTTTEKDATSLSQA